MSGGSYEYLCYKDPDEMLSGSVRPHLEAMAERLSKLGWADDAAQETYEVLAILRQTETRLRVHNKRLNRVWHAVEWWDSGDSGPDALDEALSRYRQDSRIEKWATHEPGHCQMKIIDPEHSPTDPEDYCEYKPDHDGPHSPEERYGAMKGP